MLDPRTNKGEFADLCRVAADTFATDNPVMLSILEKDYWVTRVLSAVAERHADCIVFKGGTSLSKGLALTRRFSEDIDLVVDVGNRGESARDTLLKAVAQDAVDLCALEMTPRESGRGVHRAVAYAFEAIWSGGEFVKPTVLLEMGTRSALQPSAIRTIGTMLASAVPDAAAELPGCKLRILDPERTLVEKLFVIHAAAMRHLDHPTGTSFHRVGRHYYDVAQLLANAEIEASVGSPSFWEMAEDHDERGAREFPKHHIGPASLNFADSPGLFPDHNLSAVLRREYERDSVLFYGDVPGFAAILQRLEEVRTRLQPIASRDG